MSSFRMTSAIYVVLASGYAFAQSPAPTPAIVARAVQWVQKNPGPARSVGLAEVRRAHGFKQDASDELARAARAFEDTDPRAAEAQELLCWRMLPVAPAQREAFRGHVARLKTLHPANAWVPVFELCVLAAVPNRSALLSAISQRPATVPGRFPTTLGEKAHGDLLLELGQSRVQAGVSVIAARTYEPLHALRDLDRALTREADFLRHAQREADAKNVLAVRDRYRQAYRKASRHVVEKLFALHLAGDTKSRDALLTQAKALPYLHDAQQLATLLRRMDDQQAWTLLVEPLLSSELSLLDSPPDLTQVPARDVAELQIKAGKKSVQGTTVRYEAGVRFRIRGLEVACDRLAVLNSDKPAAVVLAGELKVRLHGVADFPSGVTADRFTYHAETGTFSLGGDVRFVGHAAIIKVRSCTLSPSGEIRDRRTWLDDFRNALSIEAKLGVLSEIAKVYDDAELPNEVRYLLALNLLRPHLTWHAPYLPPHPDRKELRDLVKKLTHNEYERDHRTPWQEALGGEKWMLPDIPPAAEAAYRDALRTWYKKFNDARRDAPAELPDIPVPTKELYFWRLRDPQHADVARAIRLLRGIRAENLHRKARRWAAELERNNTVVTFDITGAAAAGKAHSLLMDVRNAERVNFKLYRVRQPEELLYAARKIGADFLFRDHGLDARLRRDREMIVKEGSKHGYKSSGLMDETQEWRPAWQKQQLAHQWQVAVTELEHHPSQDEYRSSRRWRDDDWHDDADARYFDDDCSEHQHRIDKTYRPDDDRFLPSSWQCDRVVRIPEKVLSEAGAYVLVAECNGITAHVPIVVDPISLTLRRCRDGVFALVSDADARAPLESARVFPSIAAKDGGREGALTDKEGVAFARVLAYGDQPIVAHHNGRYAIGGFGRVFDSIYNLADDFHGRMVDRLKRADRKAGEAKDASVFRYADRHVLVAYTDRPTYRPGQEVQFKLIVRKLQPETTVPDAPRLARTFRGDEFDARTSMVLPDLTEVINYAVLDPKGREVAHGSSPLSEFGTAAGKFALNNESMVGAYTFRVRIAGEPRLAPEVFAVQHYRRPNFEVQVTGVPETLVKPEILTVKLAARYYFGTPVSKGTVNVRVLRKNFGKAFAEGRAELDEKGHAKAELRLPVAFEPGKYLVVCAVTDDSGRTVSTTTPLAFEPADAPKGTTGLDAAPRFLAVAQEWKLPTSSKEIRARQDLTDLRFPVKNGVAVLKFAQPGWYHLTAGDDESSIFVYGGNADPRGFASPEKDADRQAPRWVNLSDFAHEDHGHYSRWEDPSQHLYALFDRHTAKVGDKLRLLVFVPHQSAKILFTLEGRTILDYAVVASQEGGGYQVVEIPVKERCFPNFYVQGRILAPTSGKVLQDVSKKLAVDRAERDDDDHDPRWCRVDVVRAAGSVAAGLIVQIETDQPGYRPGDTVRASVKVTDHAGRPRAAELSFAAIDESVYAFGEDNLDGLPSFFRRPHEARLFQPKAWRVSVGTRWTKNAKAGGALQQQLRDMAKAASEMLSGQGKAIHSLEMPDLTDQHFAAAPLPRLGGEMPAGQVPLARLREHFQETAVWLPQLRTDDTGTARVSFTLPDSLTRYRLNAVALTKTTEVGIGRARITAGLPLAVQVFVPRFAIEKDRLQAVAIIHNHSAQERECEATWQIAGATVDAKPPDWKLVRETATSTVSGRIKVPANSSAKVGLWLKLDQIGTARIALRATDGKETDAEVRTVPIHALGRPAEINANEEVAAVPLKKAADKQIAGRFHGEGRVQLPAGFLARDLHISLATSDLAQALDGLDYLVDYPHGCIEQTMSRFMPLVMIKHATQNSPVQLQPEIAKKLPDILEKGLTRVYGHQHTDGSWGWFAKDGRNFQMSVYVVYGLARCQAVGTTVDPQILKTGCGYLLEELRTGKHEPELVARAWYVLALAGHAPTKELETLARFEAKTVQHYRPVVWCNLALACRAAGLNELGEQLWLRRNNSWWGHDTETFALVLNTEIAFGAPYHQCRTSAARLLARRSGTHWRHTRDTAWAIEALSNMLGYVPVKGPARKLEVTLAGKKILDIKDGADLKKLVHRIHLSGDQLPQQEGLEIRFKSDSDEPILVAVRAVGVERQDEVKASGTRIKLQRYVETLDGDSVKGPLKVGQVVRIRLRLDLQEREEFLLLEERRASLCEFAHDTIAGASARLAVHQEFRDDRLCVFFTSLAAGSHEIIYYVRAETLGQSTVLPGRAFPMYNEKQRGESASNKLEVK